MRPFVVGPSPVITPSPTMPRTHAATPRLCLLGVSTVPSSSLPTSTKADIVSSFLFQIRHCQAGAGERSMLHSHLGHMDSRRGVRRFDRKDVKISERASQGASI